MLPMAPMCRGTANGDVADPGLHIAVASPLGVGPDIFKAHAKLPQGTRRHPVYLDGTHGSINGTSCYDDDGLLCRAYPEWGGW